MLSHVLLPHLVAGLGLLLVSAYAGYLVFIAPLHLAQAVTILLFIILLLCLGVIAFGYSVLSASVFALYEACVAWEHFIDYTLDNVQEKALSKLAGFQGGLAKTQAKVLIRGSIREVFQSIPTREMASWPRWLSALCLGGLMLAMRSVLIARIVKWSGTTVKISKIFTGKATIVGAILLNLRFFALILLGLVYMSGGMVLVLDLLLVGWVK